MSTPVQVQPTTVKPAKSSKKPKAPKEQSRANWLVRLTLVIVVIGFLIPTIGLFVTSFRTKDDAASTGWWTALFQPFSSRWTLSNYGEVLSDGMANAFVNSIAVTIPATVIPILIAAMAIQAAGNVPTRSKLLNSWSSGTKATWFGITSRPTTMMKIVSRPGNSMNVNAYAAPTQASACRWRSSSCGRTCRPCPRQ